MASNDGDPWLRAVTIIIIVTGIFSNGVVIVVFVAKSSRRILQKWRNMYLLHQSIIDITSLILLTLLRAVPIGEDTFRGGTTGVVILCKMWVSEYLLWAMYMCSTYNLVLVSLERYLAVAHPIYHRTRVTRSMVQTSLVIPWLIGFIFQGYWPAMFILDPNNGTCLPLYNCENDIPSTLQTFLSVYSFVVEYGIALIIMGYAYIQIVVKLKVIIKRNKRRQSIQSNELRSHMCQDGATNGNGSMFTLTRTPSQSNDNLVRSNGSIEERRTSQKAQKKTRNVFSEAKRNIVKTFLLVFVVFVVCWTPTEVAYLRHNLCIKELDFEGSLYGWLSLFVVINSVVNPFIYTGLYKEFQSQLKRVLFKMAEPTDVTFSFKEGRTSGGLGAAVGENNRTYNHEDGNDSNIL